MIFYPVITSKVSIHMSYPKCSIMSKELYANRTICNSTKKSSITNWNMKSRSISTTIS